MNVYHKYRIAHIISKLECYQFETVDNTSRQIDHNDRWYYDTSHEFTLLLPWKIDVNRRLCKQLPRDGSYLMQLNGDC